MKLALRSRIPVAAWLAEDDATVATAYQLYRELDEEMEARHGR